MKLLVLAAFAMLQTSAPTSGGESIHRLKPGDQLLISVNGTTYGGEFQILDDGAIYGAGFGRIVLAGKTYDEALAALRISLSKIVRPREVNLALKSQRFERVFLVGAAGEKPEVAYRPGLTLRQVLASAKIDANADQVDLQLVRAGQIAQSTNLAELLKSPSADQAVYPDDVVTLTPTAFLRVWVTGSVKAPGLVKIPAGTDVYQALSAAGGLLREEDAARPEENDRIFIRRGESLIEVPGRHDPTAKQIKLASGDALMVQPAPLIRFTVAGEVGRPGEFSARSRMDLYRAVMNAGGPSKEATLSGVVLVRRGEMFHYDLTALSGKGGLSQTTLETDDLVVIPRNERMFFVFGEVNRPGKVVMDDNRTYRLSDALTEAGGLSGRGVFRRVSVARPGADGKYAVTQYNLDEFLKDGKVSSNPELKPGDMVLFGQSKGLSVSSAMQALSAVFLFQTVSNGVSR